MLADRVLHTTTTTGTGSYDLIDPTSALYLSAVASVGTGNQLIYAVEFGASWEICRGVVTAGSPATLTRVFIRSSTGALINWGAGTKTLYSISQADILRFGGRGSLPTSAGTANAQTLAHVTPLRSLQAGMEVVFIPSITNAGATTLAVDALGAIAVLAPSGAACTGGELRVGVPARAIYNGTSWRLVSYSPAATGAALLASGDAATARGVLGATTVGAQLFTTPSAADARTTLGAPAVPITSAGPGQFVIINPGLGVGVTLPAGGQWAAFALRYGDGTSWPFGTYDGNTTSPAVAAGGTVIGAALSDRFWLGFAWRVL